MYSVTKLIYFAGIYYIDEKIYHLFLKRKSKNNTKKEIYKKTAEEIFEYVLRDMTGSSGEFFSAEDADSEGAEGKFYLWSSA